MLKKIMITITILSLVFVIAGCADNSISTGSVKHPYTISDSTKAESRAGVIHQISLDAKSNAAAADEKDLDYAVHWIAEHRDDFFTSDAIMEAAIYYGALLVYHNENLGGVQAPTNPSYNQANIGMNLVEAVSNVYRGRQTANDEMTMKYMTTVDEGLDAL